MGGRASLSGARPDAPVSGQFERALHGTACALKIGQGGWGAHDKFGAAIVALKMMGDHACFEQGI